MIRLKHLLFRYLTPLVLVIGGGLLLLAVHFGGGGEWPVVLSAVSIGLSLVFFVQKQKLDELRMFTDLFRQFNMRYDALNDALSDILLGTDELTRIEEKVLIDYFNLCGEEYLYYQQGYIIPAVWDAWLRGMREYYAHPRIRILWQKELRSGSYYGMSIDDFENTSHHDNRIDDGVQMLVAAGDLR